MTNRIELNWNLDYAVDEQRYYCSETPIDPLNLPASKAVLAGDVRTYIDTDIEVDKTYYIRISSVRNSVEKFSDEVIVSTQQTNDVFANYVDLYMPLQQDFSVVVGSKNIEQYGSNNTFETTGGISGEGYYRAGSMSFIEFDLANFFNGTMPFCIELYARSNWYGTEGIASFSCERGRDYAIATLTSESWFLSKDNVSWSYTFLYTGAMQNTWNHHAITYDGETLRVFLNGNLVQSITDTSGFNQANNRNFAIIGKKSNAIDAGLTNDFQHLRLTKGVARYTSNFIPPTEFIY